MELFIYRANQLIELTFALFKFQYGAIYMQCRYIRDSALNKVFKFQYGAIYIVNATTVITNAL